jgi:superkiller protein 3
VLKTVAGRSRTLILVFLALSPPCLPQAVPDQRLDQVKALIARRDLAPAEKMIVADMMQTPRDPELMTLLAEVRLDQGRFAEALTLLREGDDLGGATTERAYLTGLVEISRGRLSPAEAALRKAIQLDPRNAAAHYYLARLLYKRNRFDEAVQESKEAITLSPRLVRAYENIGLCYEGRQQFAEAERWYREAIRREEGQTQTEWPMLDLAKMLIRNNRAAEAKPYLIQALQINPRNSDAAFQMGVLLEKSGDATAALAQFQKVMQIDPNSANVYYRAARIEQKRGDTAQAQKDFSRFEQLSRHSHTKSATAATDLP